MSLRYRWLVACGACGLAACGPRGDADTLATGEGSSGTQASEATGTPTTSLPTTSLPTSGGPGTGATGDSGDTTGTTGMVDPSTSGVTLTSITTVATDSGDTGDTGDTGTTGVEQVFTPLALEVADFDADGTQDLLVLGVDNLDGTVARLSQGVGDGSFLAAIDPGLHGASAFPVVGELDGTPGVDVMMAQEDNQVEVFRWTGAAFSSWKLFKNTTLPRTHVISDGDGDGDDDIVWLWWDANATEFGLSLRPNGGGFFFAPVDTKIGVIAEIGVAPGSLLVGDVDGDGDGDALVFEADQAKGFLRMFGSQQGLFGAAKFVAPGLRPWVAALGDFDEDGALDVVAVERTPARLVLALGDGKGGFVVGGATDIAAPFKPFTIAVADLNGDEHLDVVMVDDQTPELRRFHGDGEGGFAAAQATPLASGAVRVHARALDGDAVLDLAVATFAAGEVTILLGP